MSERLRHTARVIFGDGSPAPNRIYWACVLGIITWAILRGVGVDPHAPPVRLWPFLIVIVGASVNLLARMILARWRERGRPLPTSYLHIGWVFVAIDFVCVAAGLRFAGGLHSAIWVISFVVVSGETLLERRREAAITRAGACAALVVGTVPLPPDTIDWPAYLLEMFVRMGLVIAVSSVNRRLRERRDNINAELANLRADLGLAEQRSLLSREIHDGVGNSLAAAVLRLELGARMREKSGDSDGALMLKDEANALRQAMTAVRDWTFLTRPWPANADRLPSDVLCSEVARLSQRTGLPITVDGAALLDAAPERARVTVLRIAQEALTNAAKHASGATAATVGLEMDGKRLKMTLTDNGAGFDTNSTTSGVGLNSMRERAGGAGGQLDIQSVPGEGTSITLRLPL